MNPQKFYQHLSEVTGFNIEKLIEVLPLENWKNQCSFGTLEGVGIFLSYVANKKIRHFESFGQEGFCLKVPERELDSSASQNLYVTLYMDDDIYSGLFKREHAKEFVFS